MTLRHIFYAALSFLAVAALAVSCAVEEIETASPSDKYVAVSAAATKAATISDVPSTFAVWGYVWPDGEAMGTPTWMCGEDFVKDGTLWRSTLRHGNIPAGYLMRLWGMWPKDAAGLTGLPLAGTAGVPSFGYTVPRNVAAQQDLIVAWGDTYDIQPATFPLVFRHALSCVLFKTATENVQACTIKSISIGTLKETGTYTEGSGWSGLSGAATYLITPNQAVATSDIDVRVGTEAQTMILMPQVLPAAATVSVDFRRAGASSDETLTASLEGLELEMGYKTVIRLIIPEPAEEPEGAGTLSLEVTTMPWAEGHVFNYDSDDGDVLYDLDVDKEELVYDAGGTAMQFSVRSTVSRDGSVRPMPWKAQYSLDGTSWTDLSAGRPALLVAFPASYVPSSSVSQFAAGAGAQPVLSHEARLRASSVLDASGAPVDNSVKARAVDLSKYDFVTRRTGQAQTTANCYVVSAPGWYKLPLVYGNLIEGGAVAPDACKGSSWALGHLDYFKKANDFNIYSLISGYEWLDQSLCDHAVLLWEKWTRWNGSASVTTARAEGAAPVSGVITDVEINSTEKYIYFRVPEAQICPGNAVLATCDSDGGVCWSWHIWITDQTMTPKSVGGNSFLPVNVGWTDDTQGLYYPERSAMLRFVSTENPEIVSRTMRVVQPAWERVSTSGWQVYYQWGRKDPLSDGVTTVLTDDGLVNKSIKNPSKIMYDTSTSGSDKYYDWTSANYNNLWDSQNTKWNTPSSALPDHKTVYDPSPRGFSVPPDTFMDAVAANLEAVAGKGVRLVPAAGDTLFVPAAGAMGFVDAAVSSAGTDGYYWSERPGANTQKRASYSFRFRLSGGGVQLAVKDHAATAPFTTPAYRAYGYAVRSVMYD